MFVVNGQAKSGMWRIDDASESPERMGIDFLAHPAATASTRAMAERIVRILNTVTFEDDPDDEEHGPLADYDREHARIEAARQAEKQGGT